MSSDTVEKAIASDSTMVPRQKALQRQLLSKLYALPVPLRTYPLPTFVPHNPFSLFHIVYTWIIQTLSPPSSHPDVLYEAWFSPQSQSVHVADLQTMRALWEQGFFGKGTLSRSEPSWLEREKQRRGDPSAETAEERTRQRRAERQQVKWERARKEREAIDQKLAEERQARELKNSETLKVQEPITNGSHSSSLDSDCNKKADQPSLTRIPSAPVDPMALLLLPNSDREISDRGQTNDEVGDDYEQDLENTVLELESLMAEAMKGDDVGDLRLQQSEDMLSGIVSQLPKESESRHKQEAKEAVQHTLELIDEHSEKIVSSELPNEAAESRAMYGVMDVNAVTESVPATPEKHIRSPKSVRFSPTMEQTVFATTSPPSPDSAALSAEQVPITHQEHLQLTMEESFFLSYGLGVLKVLDPVTQQPLSNPDLLRLCRKCSYFPSKANFTPSPDDPFMLSYVVYHHFRSLGWVVRGGVKFGIDFLLYHRGPVFSHAEFAIQILPSYSHPHWSANEETTEYVKSKERRDWHWLHCVNRVNGQVKKTLVLVYVDIPPPVSEVEEEEALGIDGVLGRYRVREVVLRRWLFNRMR